jgi:hypothetical protein
MNYNSELPKIVRFEYRPESGYLFVRCLFEEWPGREVEGTYGFQLSRTGVFFICPTRGKDHVLFPLGEAATAEEAVEIVKQFLKKWLSLDVLTYGDFQNEVAREISRLKEEQVAQKK